MTPSMFMRLLVKNRIAITPEMPERNLRWDDLMMAKYATQYMNFGCQNCNRPQSSLTGENQRCCGGCATNIGYLRQVPSNLNIIGIYAKAFKEDTGFWRPDGCAIPRELRSETCVCYYCSEKNITIHEAVILQLIRQGIPVTEYDFLMEDRSMRKYKAHGQFLYWNIIEDYIASKETSSDWKINLRRRIYDLFR